MTQLRVFVSSVQKELEPERVAIASLITTDPFLMQHCEPVLWEKEPAPARPADKPYLGMPPQLSDIHFAHLQRLRPA
jgi:ATP-dependent DNA helicase RecG